LMIKEGELNLDFDDDIIGPSCAVHQSEAKHPRIQAALSVTSK
jgi:H+-translocating NAD(P) transhydrogenase subunit alpha